MTEPSQHTRPDDGLDALIASAFAADTPPVRDPAAIASIAMRRPQERPSLIWIRRKPRRIGWAAAGAFAVAMGCATGVASNAFAVPSDLDFACGAVASPMSDFNGG